jgi:hypothetical protein
MLKNNVKETSLEDGTKVSNLAKIKDATKSHFEAFNTDQEGANPVTTTSMLEQIASIIP